MNLTRKKRQELSISASKMFEKGNHRNYCQIQLKK